jgi:hypothetical protein
MASVQKSLFMDFCCLFNSRFWTSALIATTDSMLSPTELLGPREKFEA